jgi:hypothetical protein
VLFRKFRENRETWEAQSRCTGKKISIRNARPEADRTEQTKQLGKLCLIHTKAIPQRLYLALKEQTAKLAPVSPAAAKVGMVWKAAA